MTSTGFTEYRIAHLRDRLARGETAELGVRVETRGARAVLWGCVPDEECRAAVLRIAGEELTGLAWYDDLTVSHRRPPRDPEELP
ncbi:BON domain-containing protein [Streptomyces sp. NPDC002587]